MCVCSLLTEVPDETKFANVRRKARVDYEEENISDDDEYLCELMLCCVFIYIYNL